MHNRPRPGSRRSSILIPTLLFALLLALGACGMTRSQVLAHAELVRSEPPADGLVVSSPDQISLTFTEEVESSDPAPVVTLLNQQGDSIGSNPLPLAASDDPRTIVLAIPGLDPGTYTVSWTVTSATDGHTLSGTYAFRVGGGLPPGLAASADDFPAIWAVALRWLTFLGASIAAGLMLFGEILIVNRVAGPRWRRVRARLILGGALLALLATLAEPLLQWLLDPGGNSASLGDVVRGMPDGWWWRPGALIPLAVLAVIVAYPLRGAISRTVAGVGGGLALASLLGLVMTSHAAGRADYRVLAIVSDALHQGSVALWLGGLVALVTWVATRDGADAAPSLRLRRFSSIALALFLVAVASGIVNAGFVFPTVDEIRDNGFSLDAFDPLWTSNYGIVLLVKVLILLVPLALAWIHRSWIAKLGQDAAALLGTIPAKFRKTLRWELAAVAVVVLGGSTMALSSPPPAPLGNVLDKVTLIASTSPVPGPESMLVHLTLDPAQAGDNAIAVRLTDWEGVPLAADPAPRVALDFTSLDHGTVNAGVNLQPASGEPMTYRTAGLNLSLDGWWQIDATVMRDNQPDQAARFFSLLPDPNTQGFDAPPGPKSDPDAEALFNTAYTQMLDWERVRWTEDIGSGQDVLVRGNFAVVEGDATTPSAYSLDVVYSAGFEPLANGDPPRPPTYNSRSSITIGDQGWLRTTDGDWLDEQPTSFSPPSGWDSIYTGADHFRMGTTQALDGTPHQVITFHLPELPTRSEAWFAWWIDPATGNVTQVTMIARQHYMVWTYSDINGDFTIDPPVAN